MFYLLSALVGFCYVVDGGMSVVDSDSEESDEGSIITTDEHEVITSNTIVHDYASVVDAVRWVIRRYCIVICAY